MRKFSLALAQINTCLGMPEANLETHLARIREAKGAGADLLVFPELSLTGYVLQDLAPEVAHRPAPDDPLFAPLLEASRSLDIVVGFVEEGPRHRFYIADACLNSAFGKVPIAHHSTAAIRRLDVRVLLQQAFQLCLDSLCNQITGTLPDQLVQRVVTDYLWL